jgi:ATP-dependent Clp protease protease subunit
LYELLGKHTGQPLERIEREFERDRWFSAQEAQRYGIVDNVIAQAGALTTPHHEPMRDAAD